jgi:cephalosporin hydroxylase
MNDFSDFFWNHPKKLKVHKWHHYFDIYDRHFLKYKGTNPVILEIGVAKGGSLEMWNYYFKGECTIYGIDIDPQCKKYESEFSNVKIFIGDQSDTNFLNQIKSEVPKVDILIDDGSHMNRHIIKSFEELYSTVTPGGTYLIEDLHTSYWSEYYGGGLLRPGTAIEYLKTLIDKLNAKHQKITTKQFSWSKEAVHKPDDSFSITTNSLHFYDSIAVIEKHRVPQLTVENSIR